MTTNGRSLDEMLYARSVDVGIQFWLVSHNYLRAQADEHNVARPVLRLRNTLLTEKDVDPCLEVFTYGTVIRLPIWNGHSDIKEWAQPVVAFWQAVPNSSGAPDTSPAEEDVDPAAPGLSSDVLEELYLNLQVMGMLQCNCQELVELGRSLGATWQNIGQTTGASAQAAYQRWSPQGRAKHAEYQRRRRADDS